jgi:Xaa-Pro aminopeptidase
VTDLLFYGDTERSAAMRHGLRVHEDPGLGRVGDTALVAGDVIALAPGLRQSDIGGVRFEDLLLVTRHRGGQ